MEIINSFLPLTIVAKLSFSHIYRSRGYTSNLPHCLIEISVLRCLTYQSFFGRWILSLKNLLRLNCKRFERNVGLIEFLQNWCILAVWNPIITLLFWYCYSVRVSQNLTGASYLFLQPVFTSSNSTMQKTLCNIIKEIVKTSAVPF